MHKIIGHDIKKKNLKFSKSKFMKNMEKTKKYKIHTKYILTQLYL